jgi:aryl-alcohol dehydrogenase-like predicted oxidoreductase
MQYAILYFQGSSEVRAACFILCSHLTQLIRSLSLLKTDYIDLYYQHRVDTRVPIEVVLETLRPFLESGKIKYLGLSECTPETLRRAKAVKGVGEKIIAVQMEFSPFELEIEKNGFVDVARELGVGIVAYSPLARGLVAGQYVSLRTRKFPRTV